MSEAHVDVDAAPAAGAAARVREIRCLSDYTLTNLQTQTEAEPDGALLAEPRHGHTGVGLAAELRQSGMGLTFANQLETRPWHRLLKLGLLKPDALCLSVARRYDALLAYSLPGSLLTNALVRTPGRRPAVVLVQLSRPNPGGPKWRAAFRLAATRAAIARADAVVYSIHELAGWYEEERLCEPDRLYYSPTGVDVEFFDPALAVAADRPAGVPDRPFLLCTGDSFRDDAFMYDAVKGVDLPVVRVTRDQRVVDRVGPLLDPKRGDVTLTRISFPHLRWLYTHCAAFMMSTRLDHWQAAGSTALTESLSCGAPSLCQGGGCLEREWKYLASEVGTETPARFFEPGNRESFRAELEAILRLSPEADRRLRQDGRDAAVRTFSTHRSYGAIVAAIGGAVANKTRGR